MNGRRHRSSARGAAPPATLAGSVGGSATGGLAAGIVALLVAGLVTAITLGGGGSPTAAPGAGFPAQFSAGGEVQQAVPLTVRIPRLDVSSRLIPLAVDSAGALQPPESPDVAGWHATGTPPGDVGPAVIAGHVDSRAGPGVFFALGELEPGDEILVGRSDAETLTFQVLSTESVGKSEFPTERVYGPTPLAELRLVTCGGEFDRGARRYLDNVIVRAAMV